MYGLADCNNFFVSCERAFQPNLEGLPLVVLSNNDGCVVARSNESKAMGIKMGVPYFQIKDYVAKGKLFVRSSNHNLYGDISSRVMSILADIFPAIDIYSIDEAFLAVDGIRMDNLKGLADNAIYRVRKWVGIPISIGFAPTRTLAKVANHFAKKYKGYGGVCIIDNDEKREKALKLTPISEVWGIGRRLSPKLESVGVRTAFDLTLKPQCWVQSKMGVVGVRIYKELKGIDSTIREKHDRKQSICTSRSFSDMIVDENILKEKIADFASMCASKLRKEGSVAQKITVFLRTNVFREDLAQYKPEATVSLYIPVNNSSYIISAALRAFHIIFKSGYMYKKAGVIVSEIVAANEVQAILFDNDCIYREKQDRISGLMDKINREKNILKLASQGSGHFSDCVRRDFCSKSYSTNWNELIDIQ